MKLKNQYFLLRHGQTSYQAKRKPILYHFPEKKPIELTKKGKSQIAESVKKLASRKYCSKTNVDSCKIDLIFSSEKWLF